MRTLLAITLMLMLSLCGYLGSYFALVRRGGGESNLGFNYHEPAYRLCPPGRFTTAATFFKPAHTLDRRLLRPAIWVEKVDITALIAAELGKNAAAGEPNQQGGADGRQPLGSETDWTSAAAAPRRSP